MERSTYLQEQLNILNIAVLWESNFSVEDDTGDLTTVEFNKKITTEVQNLHVKK